MLDEKIAVGIPVAWDDDDVHRTIESVHRNSPSMACPVLLAGSERDVASAALYPNLPCLLGKSALPPDFFNLLRSCEEYTFIILLEPRVLVARGWLEPLVECLRDPATGAVGPSTNLGGGLQQTVVLDTSDWNRIAACARALKSRYGSRTLTLKNGPMAFCYGIRRQLAVETGPACSGGPPEKNFAIEYNHRLRERGFRNRWVCSSLVYRKLDSARFAAPDAVSRKERPSHPEAISCKREPASVTAIPIHRRRPLVSCIMPTHNRRSFVPQAIRYFLRQRYQLCELLIVDDSSDQVRDLIPPDPRLRYFRLQSKATVGAKRNFACERARGEIILHWDDDDWHSDHQIAYQVETLLSNNADVCGFSPTLFYDTRTGEGWLFRYPANQRFWVHGSSMCYRRSFWETNRFEDIDVGEDVRFLWNSAGGRMMQLDDFTHHINMIHDHNISPKNTGGEYWHAYPGEELRRLLGNDLSFYLAMLKPGAALGTPLISCIMPTFNRRAFIPLTLSSFHSQTYPHKELVVVDDGSDSVASLCEGVQDVRYVRVPGRMTIGAKRNLARRESSGEIIAHWDDDDWYAPRRLEVQTAPILAGYADITGLVVRYLLQMLDGQFWTVDDDLHRRMFVGDVAGGTLVYNRNSLAHVSYPEVDLAEDAQLLREALRQNKRLVRFENEDLFVYMRHRQNTWQFSPGRFMQTKGWRMAQIPPGFSAELLDLYRAAAHYSR